MANVTNSLVTAFTFEGGLTPLENYNSKYSTALNLMSKGIGIVTAINGAMMAFANSQFDAIDAMGQLSRETATSVEYMQEMGYVASVNGGSVDALQDSVRGLSERIGEYASQDSGEGKAIFEKLGISIRNANGDIKNAEDVMEDLRGKFQNINKVEQVSIAQKLGINSGMLQTLNLTNSQLDETRKKVKSIGIVSTEDANKVMAFNDAMTTSKMGLSAISRQISLGMLPNMMLMVESFNELLFANADLIKGGLSKTIYWLQSTMDAVINTGKVIFNAIDYFVGFENALLIAGAAVLYFNKALLKNPITLIVAGIATLILIVDDLYAAFTGGKSVIKDFFGAFNVDIVNTLRSAFDGLKFTFNSILLLMLKISSAFTDLTLMSAKGANFLGMGIDTKGIEEFKKMQEQTKISLSAENRRIANDVVNRSYSTNQTVNINQNIQGTDSKTIADTSSTNIKDALQGANNQIQKGSR